MTPAMVSLMQRLASGEIVTCIDKSDPQFSILLRARRGGHLEFKPVLSREPTWHDAGIFHVSSLARRAEDALPPEPTQQRQVRSIDLSE